MHHGEERTRRPFAAGITSLSSNFLSEVTSREVSCSFLSPIAHVGVSLINTDLSFDIRFAGKSLKSDSRNLCPPDMSTLLAF